MKCKVDDVWRSFTDWVQKVRPKDDWLSVKNLKPRTKPEVASVVQRAFDNLFRLLKKEGIMDESNVLLEAEAQRLLCTDEKGMSQRAGPATRGVLDKAHTAKAAGVVGETNFEHLTVTTFLPAAGDQYPLGVVTPTKTKRLHPEFDFACPGAVFAAHETGSTTAQTFCFFVLEFLKKARERIPLEKAVVLILDTGGGCLLHVSMPLVKIALQYNCKLLYLPGYTTKALMALDQVVHSEMSRLWSVFKQSWASHRAPLTLFVALRALHVFSQKALAPDKVRASWARVGCYLGKKWDVNVVLVERAAEVFSSTREKSLPQSVSASSALALLKEVAPAKK